MSDFKPSEKQLARLGVRWVLDVSSAFFAGFLIGGWLAT